MLGPVALLVAALTSVSQVVGSAASKSLPNMERESMLEAASITKKLVHTSLTGTIASTFPSQDSRTPNFPYAIMEYHAPCHSSPALTFLLFPESISTRNILASPQCLAGYTLSMPVEGVRSPVARARVAFMGNMTLLHDIPSDERQSLEKCFRHYHPDVFWFPGEGDHPWDSMWARFDPVDIYFVGGFGDTHYIGHIPVDVYAAADEDARDATWRVQDTAAQELVY